MIFNSNHFNTITDPNMNSSQATQAKTNHEEHIWIKTIDATNLDMVEPTDLGKSTKHHLQSRRNMIIKPWQSQGESIKNLITTLMQYRNMYSGQQTTEQPSDCQPTLRTIERLVWCTYQHGNPRDGILGNEIRSQDSKIIRRVLKEPTRTVTRSYARLIFDNG